MKIKPIVEILNPNGLDRPLLNALIPNAENYKAFFIQPHGQIEVNATGVRNRDRELAQLQFTSFLNEAQKNNADLVITPEYSMPWDVLVRCIKDGICPKEGKLWTLGCESVTYSQLLEIRDDIAPHATLLKENLEVDAERFIDPLAYIFIAPPLEPGGDNKLVILVQFKTHPMGDDDHFEINNLQLGTDIYKFGGDDQQLKFISLICSDAFNLKEQDADSIYDRALIIHIQLNQSPRQTQYRQYRDKLFKFSNDETELICINWARDVNEWHGEVVKSWKNIAGSAWYLKPKQFDDRDDTLSTNHKRGLYYTWFESLRTHVLFFNYEAGAYLLEATKVAHIGVIGSISRRRGPQLSNSYCWCKDTNSWIEKDCLEDGFSEVLNESGNAKEELCRIAKDNPLEVERILALCAGKNENLENWHLVCKLDSFRIGLAEIVYRITFCQDTDAEASIFRISRLKRCRTLWEILKNKDQLPEALADLKSGFNFKWSQTTPHQNAISSSGKYATLIYMGEESSLGQIEATSKRMAEILNRGFSNPDDSHNARQRLAVWYRNSDGNITQFRSDKFIRYDDAGSNAEFDLGREE